MRVRPFATKTRVPVRKRVRVCVYVFCIRGDVCCYVRAAAAGHANLGSSAVIDLALFGGGGGGGGALKLCSPVNWLAPTLFSLV